MKKITTLLIYILLAGLSNFAFADYPIVSYSYLADPGAIWHEGRLYVYCSNDNENPIGGNSYKMSTIVCVSSADLKNWTNHGVVLDTKNVSWSGLSWAPSPVYKNGKFYLYYGNGGSAIGVAVSDSPTGPFVDPLGRSLASGNTPGVQPFDGWLFDPMTFVDDDGQAYMYFGGNGDNNMRVARLNSDMISINGSVGKINVPNLFEAAWLHKYNGTYYFSYSTNPSNGMRIDYMTSNNPMTGFTYGGVISNQPPINNNNNHQAIVEIEGEWYQVYHNRIVARDNLGTAEMPYHRNLAIDKFTHNANGTINRMVNTVDGVKQLKYLDPYVRQEGETMSNQKGIDVIESNAGGMALGYIDNGDWTMIEGVDFGSGASVFSASVASTKTGGTIEIRTGSATGTLLGTLQVPNTGGNQTWRTVTTSIAQTTGVKNLYLVFKGSGSSLFNIDHWKFLSKGPIVTLTAPLSTTEVFAGDNVTINATATPNGANVTGVQFLVDGTSIGSDNTSPYTFTYSNATNGTHVIEVVATDANGDKGSSKVTINVRIPQGPYNGTVHAIPGTIQFEHYDVGGNGFAYLDDSPDNTGGATFRMDEDVDIENCTDAGTGYNIGFATAGEWLEYTVEVAKPGIYSMDLRVACNGDGRTLNIAMDGEVLANNVAIPNTAGWQTWQTVKVNNINLTPGKKIMRVTLGETDYINLNYVTFTLVKELKQEPFNSTAHMIPGRIEAEEYDLGGEGLAYHEANAEGNQGGAMLRDDEVDVEVTQDTDGDYNIAYILEDEWLEYTVDVTSTGDYDLDIRVAKDGDGGLFHIEIDGEDVTGGINVPNTAGWQVWETITLEKINLTEGEHIMRLVFESNYFNLNYLEFKGLVTSANLLSDEKIELYPNPFSSEGLHINLYGVFNYIISDMNGVLQESGIGSNKKAIGTSLAKGVYFLKIESENGSVIQKIIKL